jgi:zinc transport system permease protein
MNPITIMRGAAMNELLLQAVLAAAGVGMLAGMLGCFVLWRRMAYMGDAMGHASLLGVVLGLMLGVVQPYAVVVVAIVVGMLIGMAQKDKRLPFDALLGVVSTGGLAAGLLLYSLSSERRVDLYGYLFGDVLAVSQMQLMGIYGALAVQMALVTLLWRPLLRMIMQEEIARVEGVPVQWLQVLLTVLIAVTVALALQVVGLLLITALLIVPPLAARALATSPLQMMLGSMLLAVLAAAGGIWLSFAQNLSAGPSIVVVAVGLFALSLVAGRLFKRLH